jgi:hypothetical protein
LLQLLVYFAVLTALAVPLGRYMAAVYEGRATLAQRVLGPLERRDEDGDFGLGHVWAATSGKLTNDSDSNARAERYLALPLRSSAVRVSRVCAASFQRLIICP